MIKLITLLKRRPGMSREDFIAYYETNHARIGEKVLRGAAVHYVRRYLQPLGPEAPEPPFDVVMEIWFPDRETLDRRMGALVSDPVIAAEIAEDEEKLFDRSSIVSFIADEHVSAL